MLVLCPGRFCRPGAGPARCVSLASIVAKLGNYWPGPQSVEGKPSYLIIGFLAFNRFLIIILEKFQLLLKRSLESKAAVFHHSSRTYVETQRICLLYSTCIIYVLIYTYISVYILHIYSATFLQPGVMPDLCFCSFLSLTSPSFICFINESLRSKVP